MQDRSSRSERASFPGGERGSMAQWHCVGPRYNGDGIINETSATNLGQGVTVGSLSRIAGCHLHAVTLFPGILAFV